MKSYGRVSLVQYRDIKYCEISVLQLIFNYVVYRRVVKLIDVLLDSTRGTWKDLNCTVCQRCVEKYSYQRWFDHTWRHWSHKVYKNFLMSVKWHHILFFILMNNPLMYCVRRRLNAANACLVTAYPTSQTLASVTLCLWAECNHNLWLWLSQAKLSTSVIWQQVAVLLFDTVREGVSCKL